MEGEGKWSRTTAVENYKKRPLLCPAEFALLISSPKANQPNLIPTMQQYLTQQQQQQVHDSPLSTPSSSPYDMLLKTPQQAAHDPAAFYTAAAINDMAQFSMDEMYYLDGFLSEVAGKPLHHSKMPLNDNIPQPLSIPSYVAAGSDNSVASNEHILGQLVQPSHNMQYITPSTPNAPQFVFDFAPNTPPSRKGSVDSSFDELLLSGYPSPATNLHHFGETHQQGQMFGSADSLSTLLSPVSPQSKPKKQKRKSSLSAELSLNADGEYVYPGAGGVAEDEEGAEMNPDGTKKLHPCPHSGCGRLFTRLYNVKSHMVCHSGDRPHICNACSASFRRKHDLQRHFRTTHSTERPWTCKKCHRSFARRDHYRRHMQVEENIEERRTSALKEIAQFQQHYAAQQQQQQQHQQQQSFVPIYGM